MLRSRYAEFVRDVLRQFCDKAAGIEVGNEPDSVVYYGNPMVATFSAWYICDICM